MDETTTPQHRHTPTHRRSRTRRRIIALTAGGFAALLAWNSVSVRTETAEASGEQIVHVPGGDLHVVQEGSRDAPGVVLLHGLAGSTAWWEPVLPALRDLHVVRVDLLGHGRSAKPTDGYGIADQAARLGTALDRLGVRRATVVGHSTGGAVATSLAEQRRDLVTAVALVDTGPRADAFLGESFTADLMTTPVVGELLWRLRTDGVLRGALSSAFTREVRVPEQLVADIRGMTYRSLTATDAAVDAFLAERSVPDRLARLDLPVMVLFGAQDRRWQPASAQDYRRVPGARIEILDGVGHTPMFEDPDTTGVLLRDFAGAGRARL